MTIPYQSLGPSPVLNCDMMIAREREILAQLRYVTSWLVTCKEFEVHQQVSQHCRGPASFSRANPNHRLSSPIKQTKTTTRKPWPPKLTN